MKVGKCPPRFGFVPPIAGAKLNAAWFLGRPPQLSFGHGHSRREPRFVRLCRQYHMFSQNNHRTAAGQPHQACILWLNLPTVSNVALVPSRYLVRKNTFDTGEAAL